MRRLRCRQRLCPDPIASVDRNLDLQPISVVRIVPCTPPQRCVFVIEECDIVDPAGPWLATARRRDAPIEQPARPILNAVPDREVVDPRGRCALGLDAALDDPPARCRIEIDERDRSTWRKRLAASDRQPCTCGTKRPVLQGETHRMSGEHDIRKLRSHGARCSPYIREPARILHRELATCARLYYSAPGSVGQSRRGGRVDLRDDAPTIAVALAGAASNQCHGSGQHQRAQDESAKHAQKPTKGSRLLSQLSWSRRRSGRRRGPLHWRKTNRS